MLWQLPTKTVNSILIVLYHKESLIYSYIIYTTITSLTLSIYIVYKSTIPLLQDKHAVSMLLILHASSLTKKETKIEIKIKKRKIKPRKID